MKPNLRKRHCKKKEIRKEERKYKKEERKCDNEKEMIVDNAPCLVLAVMTP